MWDRIYWCTWLQSLWLLTVHTMGHRRGHHWSRPCGSQRLLWKEYRWPTFKCRHQRILNGHSTASSVEPCRGPTIVLTASALRSSSFLLFGILFWSEVSPHFIRRQNRCTSEQIPELCRWNLLICEYMWHWESRVEFSHWSLEAEAAHVNLCIQFSFVEVVFWQTGFICNENSRMASLLYFYASYLCAT